VAFDLEVLLGAAELGLDGSDGRADLVEGGALGTVVSPAAARRPHHQQRHGRRAPRRDPSPDHASITVLDGDLGARSTTRNPSPDHASITVLDGDLGARSTNATPHLITPSITNGPRSSGGRRVRSWTNLPGRPTHVALSSASDVADPPPTTADSTAVAIVSARLVEEVLGLRGVDPAPGDDLRSDQHLAGLAVDRDDHDHHGPRLASQPAGRAGTPVPTSPTMPSTYR